MRVGPGGRKDFTYKKRFAMKKRFLREKKILHFSLDSFTLLSLVSVFGRGLGLGSLTSQNPEVARLLFQASFSCLAGRMRESGLTGLDSGESPLSGILLLLA